MLFPWIILAFLILYSFEYALDVPMIMMSDMTII